MGSPFPITTLFLDIGGVLLSNDWGHESRKLAAETFHLKPVEIEGRHSLNMVTHEEGKLTLSEYLNRVIFYENRSFTPDQFGEFMFRQTTPNGEIIEFIAQKLFIDLQNISHNGTKNQLTEIT